MSHHIPDVVTWCLAAALIAVAVLLVRQRGIAAALRLRAATLEEGQRARDSELGHLVNVRLPAVTASMQQPVPLPGLLDEQLTGTVFAHGLQSVMDTFTQAVDKAQARADQSAKAALKASMRALQGLAHEQQLAISDMQDRHDNPDVLRDLLQIDHANSQFGRRAQAIAVLCGSWPGRQRAASPLTDVVRGATSRIRDYRRVQVHSQADLAVVSRAVEPVVLAVAELLDNAARHSQPNTTVEVGLQPVHNGACVVIDDAGVGMDGQETQRAGALLSGRAAVDVSRLGDPPQFGFPVIGVLAARYGFSVSVDTRSPYGGVRAVLFLPSTLLTQLDIDGPGTTPLRPPGAGAGAGVGAGSHVADRTAATRAPGRTPVPDFPDFPEASAAAFPESSARGPEGPGGFPEASGRGSERLGGFPETSARGPEAPGGFPETSARNREARAGFPEATARHREASAGFPEASTRNREAQAGFPESSTRSPEAPTGFPETSVRSPEAQAGFPGMPGGSRGVPDGPLGGGPISDGGPVAGARPGADGGPVSGGGGFLPGGGSASDGGSLPGEAPVHGTFGSTAGGLPKRRRRQPSPDARRGRPAPLSAESPAPGAPGSGPAAPERTAEETARRMGAFARGTRAGRTPAAGTPVGPLHGTPEPDAAHPFAQAPAPVDDEGNPHA
ncbi:ATP-binding protein [Streptomyces roseifaciens]|uniref:ATP-binding protein n=1 Tax=Streptomyces roseifaciens TaxID=1488406 RepID=UPI000AA57459